MSIQKNKIEQHNIWRGNSMSEIPTLRFSRKSFPSSRFHSKTSGFLFFFKNESNLLYLLSEIE